MNVIEAKSLKKVYDEDTIPVYAVNGIDLEIQKGEFTAIVGASGCGKTTLLNMLGGLETSSQGSIHINGTDISELSAKELTDFRLHHIGFVFQAYNLIPVLTAKENAQFIMEMQGANTEAMDARVKELFESLEIGDKINTRPGEMSGGQQQRVAVARALASKPDFIIADEPTANLDSKATATLLDMMLYLNEKENTTFIFATHDERVMKRARRIIVLEDGKVIEDKFQG